jgi:hypothetical protein
MRSWQIKKKGLRYSQARSECDERVGVWIT